MKEEDEEKMRRGKEIETRMGEGEGMRGGKWGKKKGSVRRGWKVDGKEERVHEGKRREE